MSATLDEATPYTEGFERYYAQEIAPALRQMEDRRKAAVRQLIGLGVLLVIGLFVMIGSEGIASWAGIDDFWFALGGFAIMFGSVAAGVMIYKRVHGAFKAVLVGRTCDFLGLDFAVKGFRFPFSRFRDTGLVPKHDKRHLEDRIAGKHDGVGFELCEAHLKQRKRTRDSDGKTKTKYVTVFRGMLLRYQFPKRFSGETVVVPDATWLGNMIGGMSRDGERVTLEDPRFESQFEVYSSDQVEARYLLTPRFMERLTELAGRFGNPRGLSVAFKESDLLIAVRGGEDRFEGGHIFKSFAEPERAEKLVKELGIIFEIVDVLNLADTSCA